MSTNRPSSKYDQVYTIIRLDKSADTDLLPNQNLITVKKVVRSEEVAQREVERLNRVNADKACEYYYQISRLARDG